MITLLHTSPAHVPTFDALRDALAPGMALRHIVREDLLARARGEGITREIAAEVAALVTPGATLCTCTTLGKAAEAAGALRIDRPLMQAAAQTGGKVLLAYCLESTAGPSLSLLREEMEKTANSAGTETVFLPSAWPLFEAGDIPAFAAAIATGIRAAITPDIACIALAQASMAPAAPLLADTRLPVLASPELAFRAALASISPTG